MYGLRYGAGTATTQRTEAINAQQIPQKSLRDRVTSFSLAAPVEWSASWAAVGA
jgi:hypothetical protein